jgi:glycolate oxidase FAD binding subunit
MIPGALAAACADVRPAGPEDAPGWSAGAPPGTPPGGPPAGHGAGPGGPAPAWVASPASVAEAGALLAAAADLGLAVLPRGAGTRLGWGVPPRRCDLVVDTGRLDAVLEHAAGDQVVRVQAGVRLGALAEVLGRAGQRLALDPPGPAGTVGGLLATGAAGPLRLRYGTPRDLLLGVTMIRADGVIARSGGKVVKNVAGYDIGKLLAGSYGTLGLIAEATFRLHPAPAAAAWVSLDTPGPAAAAAALLAVASSKLAPSAAELDWPGRDAPAGVAVLLEGDAEGVAERAARAADLLAEAARGAAEAGGNGTGRGRPGVTAGAVGGPWTTDAPPPWWGAAPGDGDGTVVRVAFWAGRLAAVLAAIRAAADRAGLDPAVGGSGAAGVLHVAVSADAPPDAVAGFVTGLRAALGGGTSGNGQPTAASGRRAPDEPAGGGPTGGGAAGGGPTGVEPTGSGPAGGGAAGGGPAGGGPAGGGAAGGGAVRAGVAGGFLASIGAPQASAVVVHAPEGVRAAVDMWGPVPSLALMRAVKDQFDPGHRMAPGRFAGGI